MFIISLTYVKSLEEVDALLNEHFAYLNEQYRLGNFLASGPKIPRNGGVILARAVSREELETIVTLDPFYRQKIASYEITEFDPTMTVDALGFFNE